MYASALPGTAASLTSLPCARTLPHPDLATEGKETSMYDIYRVFPTSCDSGRTSLAGRYTVVQELV